MKLRPNTIVLTILCTFLMSQFAHCQSSSSASDLGVVANAMNALGIELLAKGSPADANALLSPYSIQSALAMTYAGADGKTREEMRRVLHYPTDESELHRSFGALRSALDEIARSTAKLAERAKEWGGPTDPITVTMANRLFGQKGYDFREPFLALVKNVYGAPFEPMDFSGNPSGAQKEINAWVEETTAERIQDLIMPDGLDRETRLVLVNAIYLKAPWAYQFSTGTTQPRPFYVKGGKAVEVPTMWRKGTYGYAKHKGFTVVKLPYIRADLGFLILFPDEVNGLPALEARMTPELLAQSARPSSAELILHLPKFKLEPPLMRLGELLQSLGMQLAFDKPRGSANFDRIAPRRPNDYLYISEVFHKTFLDLDEKGTEAAAATAVVMMRPLSAAGERPPKPIEVKVDRPFLFAIQHWASRACLFLGRVTDPR